MNNSLALMARKKGVPGMTRMYGGYHTTIGTNENLTHWFLKEGVFIEETYDIEKKEFTTRAIVMTNGHVLQTSVNMDRERGLESILTKLTSGLPDSKKVKW